MHCYWNLAGASTMWPAERAPRRAAACVVAGVAVLLGVAGCAHPGSGQARQPAVPASPAGPAGTLTAARPSAPGGATHSTARQWAAQLPGCTSVHELAVQQLGSTVPALAKRPAALHTVSSAAECSVEAQELVLLAFTSRGGERATEAGLRNIEPYFAAGPGWLAVAARPDSSTQMLSIVQGVALSLNGTLVDGTVTTPSAGAGGSG